MSILCECFCLMHSQVGTYHIGVTPSGWGGASAPSSRCHSHMEWASQLVLGKGCSLPNSDTTLTGCFHLAFRQECHENGDGRDSWEEGGFFLGGMCRILVLITGNSVSQTPRMCENQPESKIPRHCHYMFCGGAQGFFISGILLVDAIASGNFLDQS